MANVSNLFIDQGTTFSVSVDLTDTAGAAFDLTNYTATGQIRKTYSSTSVTASFSATVDVPNAAVVLELTDTQTAAIPSGRYVYDCVIESSTGVKTRIVEGQASVTPGVTR